MLPSGVKAPAFGLAQVAGGAPVVLVFFKASCPTCQMSLPFLDRIAARGLRICAVSQDNQETAAEFNKEFKIRNLEMLYDPPPYAASDAFGVTSVPSIFVIEPDGMVSQAIEGFSKADFEDLGRRANFAVFTPADRVPLMRPG